MRSKLQKKPSALKREHPALQNMKFLNFFLFLWVIFALLDQDSESESGSTDLIESGSNPGPKHCLKLSTKWRLISTQHSAKRRIGQNIIISVPFMINILQYISEAEYKMQNFPLPRNGKRCSPLSCDWAEWQVPGLSSVANVRNDVRLFKGTIRLMQNIDGPSF